jgi:hypothetical protein
MQNPLRELIEDSGQQWLTESVLCRLLGIAPHSIDSLGLLSVPSEHVDQRIYPAYQFDPATCRPWPVLKTLRLQFESADLGNWLPVWLAKPCPSLDNQPPSTYLGSLPDQVVASANRFVIRRLANPKTLPIANHGPKRKLGAA